MFCLTLISCAMLIDKFNMTLQFKFRLLNKDITGYVLSSAKHADKFSQCLLNTSALKKHFMWDSKCECNHLLLNDVIDIVS